MSTSPFEEAGGFATYTYSLCVCLKNLGYEPYVVTLSKKTRTEQTPVGTILGVSSRLASLGSAGYPLWGKPFAKAVASIVRRDGDRKFIVHGKGEFGYAGALLKKKFGNDVFFVVSAATSLRDQNLWIRRGIKLADYGLPRKLMYELLMPIFTSRFFLHFEKRMLQAADAIIVHYDYTKELLVRDCGVDPAKIHVVPYYVETYSRRLEDGEKAERIKDAVSKKPLVVCVCRQDERKGINYLLRATKELLKEAPIHVAIAGTGRLLHANEGLARKLGVGSSVTFLGRVNEIDELLAHADVFVLPSLQEGSGSLAVLEAMKIGIPIVTTKCSGGLHEDIENGVSGILVPPEDPNALATAISAILTDRELATSLAREAKLTYERRFSPERMQNGLSEVYRTFLE